MWLKLAAIETSIAAHNWPKTQSIICSHLIPAPFISWHSDLPHFLGTTPFIESWAGQLRSTTMSVTHDSARRNPPLPAPRRSLKLAHNSWRVRWVGRRSRHKADGCWASCTCTTIGLLVTADPSFIWVMRLGTEDPAENSGAHSNSASTG